MTKKNELDITDDIVVETVTLTDNCIVVLRDFDGPGRRIREIAESIVGFAQSEQINICKTVIFLRGKERIECLDEATLARLGLVRADVVDEGRGS